MGEISGFLELWSHEHLRIRVPSGPFLVSRTGAVGWTKRRVKAPNSTLMGHHERRWLLKTAGRWPWKSESAKECVTTHLPKQLALKMDGAEASSLYSAVSGKWGGNRERALVFSRVVTKPWRVGGSRRWAQKGLGASLPGAAVGADLGGSSKYSSEALEDWRGEGFRVNSRCTRVSRS